MIKTHWSAICQAGMAAAALVFPVSQGAASTGAAGEYQAEAGDLTAGLERIAFLRGNWTATQSVPTPQGGSRRLGGIALSFRSSMNDRYLETNAASAGYNYHLIFSYDTAQRLYRIISRDDRSGLIDVYEGEFSADGALVVSNLRSGTHYSIGGVRYHNRMTFRRDGSRGWVWTVDGTSDGGRSWQPQTRVEARAG